MSDGCRRVAKACLLFMPHARNKHLRDPQRASAQPSTTFDSAIFAACPQTPFSANIRPSRTRRGTHVGASAPPVVALPDFGWLAAVVPRCPIYGRRLKRIPCADHRSARSILTKFSLNSGALNDKRFLLCGW